MMRLSKFMSVFLVAALMSNLLAGCAAKTTPIPPPATPTAALPPTPSTVPIPTWDGSADLSVWQGGNDYILEAQADGLHVQANKVAPSAYIEAVFPAIDIRQAPYASLLALSDRSANITVGLVDAAGEDGWLLGNAANRELAHGAQPMTHSFDFTKLNINLAQVTGMRIAINRNAPTADANVRLNDILLGGRAVRGLGYAPLPDVEITLGDEPQPVRLYPLAKEDAGAAWQVKFPDQLVKSAGVSDDHLLYTLTGQPGSGTLVLSGEKAGKSVRLAFDLSATENQPPSLAPIAGQVLSAGASQNLRLTGLDDGDSAAAQKLSLTAQSQNEAVAAVISISFDSLNRWASLSLKAAAAGSTSITLTLTDERGASASQSFPVSVYPEINQAPSFELPAELVMTVGSELRQPLGAISGGEPNQPVTLTAQSDSPDLLATVEDGMLVLQAAQNDAASALVTVTATDSGGNARNQGNASTTRSLPVTITQPPITGFSEPFDSPQVAPALAGSGEGAHTLAIEDGALRVDINKYATNNPWAGLWYALPSELDLSANPIITLRMKAEKETTMLIFLWDANDIYNTAGTVTVLVGTEWKDYTLDFSGKNLDSEGKTVDFSRIKSLLINFAPGLLAKGTIWLDELQVGSEAKVRAAPPALEIQAPPQLTLLPGGSFTERFTVAGMAENDQVEMAGVDPQILSSAALAKDGDQMVLSLKTMPGSAGFTRLKMIIVGQDRRTAEKYLDIIIPAGDQTAQIAIDRGSRYQTMDGFGTFLGSGVWDQPKQALALPFVQDLGITVARFGIINNDFERENDNANPYVSDYNAFDSSALPLEWMRRLKAETSIDKYILTVWSPPAWMKKSRTQAAIATAGDNFLEERYYEEYAEFLVAVVRVIKEQADIDLYAISVQNEPQFNEPYPSGLLPADKMAQLLDVVAVRFAAEGIQTRLFMPEALPQQKGLEEFIRQLDLLPAASQGTDIIAIHNYDADGINVGGAGAQDWANLAQWANAARPRQVWMTETSGHPNNWSGAKLLFGNIYNALVYGHASAWVWWTLSETSGSAEYGLVVDNQPTSRYAISRHFYRAVQPGAVRVAAASDADILSVAFENPDGTLAVVLYNTGKARLVACSGAGTLLEAWVSQDSLLSRPAQMAGERILLPADGAATLLFGSLP